MDKNKVPTGRLYVSIAIPFIWLPFLAFWLFYYATNYNIIQNLGIFLASISISCYFRGYHLGAMGNKTKLKYPNIG